MRVSHSKFSFAAPFIPVLSSELVSTSASGRSLPIIKGRNLAAACTSLRDVPDVGRPSDEEMMLRLHSGDTIALEFLFDRYSRLVLSIALRVLRDYGEAEEIVQETFFHLFQRAKLFDPSKGTAKAWIIQIGLHKALDKKTYLVRRHFYLSTDIGSLDGELLGETDLDREIGARLNWMQLERAFAELPEMQRRTLELFFYQDLDLREVSQRLNEPWGNVRHYFYRGLERLRRKAFVRNLCKE